jgi:hypothetical protein
MDPEKERKLAGEGYIPDKELKCYVNKNDGRIFSSGWIEQNSVNTLQVALSTPQDSAGWKIYLNPDEPHEETMTALFAKYGKNP